MPALALQRARGTRPAGRSFDRVAPVQIDDEFVVVGPAAIDSIDLSCELVAVDGGGVAVATVGVRFTERLVSAESATVIGEDLSGALRIILAVTPPAPGFRVSLRFTPVPSALPAQLLPAVEVLDAIGHGARLAIKRAGSVADLVAPMRPPAGVANLGAGFVDAVRSLARIQHATGQTFAMPETLDDDAALAMDEADRLLGGAVVTTRWQSAEATIARPLLDAVRRDIDQPGEIRLVVDSYPLDIGGHEVDLGPAELIFRSWKLGDDVQPGDADDVNVTLRPDSDDHVDVRLTSLRQPSTTDVAVDRRSPFDGYAGQWVASSADTVVASAPSMRELVRVLRDTRQSGSIWRVPRDREEAASVLI